MQVWRPLKGPVNEAPLAIVDVTTVRTDSLMPVRLSLPARIGYTYTVKHDPGAQTRCAAKLLKAISCSMACVPLSFMCGG